MKTFSLSYNYNFRALIVDFPAIECRSRQMSVRRPISRCDDSNFKVWKTELENFRQLDKWKSGRKFSKVSQNQLCACVHVW